MKEGYEKAESAPGRIPENILWLRDTFRDIAGLLGYRIQMKMTISDQKTRKKWEVEIK